jgi:uncharacterized protein (TIGR00730 family)
MAILRHMRNICVFCSSNSGVRPDYLEAAGQLAQALVENEIGLIYGGASVGAMGVLADAVQDLGGSVIGVIPRSLVEKEIANTRLADLRVVESMHQRKALMADVADAFIALPGGLGTLDEFFEVVTWAQLGMHQKPCGLLNIAGYYDGLMGFLDHAVAEGLLRQEHRDMILVSGTAPDLISQFHAYRAPAVKKWVG